MNHKKVSRFLIGILVIGNFFSMGSGNLAMLVHAAEHQPSQTIATTDTTIETNAGVMSAGEHLSISLLLNNSGERTEKGTKYLIYISPDVVDYNSLDFSDQNIQTYFDITKNQEQGTIQLTLKKDLLGVGSTLSGKIDAKITGVAGEEYVISGEKVLLKGERQPIAVRNDTITIEKNQGGIYGAINQYWGINDQEKGNFIGQMSGEKNVGVFSRKVNQIDIFGEFNTSFQQWDELVNPSRGQTVKLAFEYGTNQALDVESIALTNETTNESIAYSLGDKAATNRPVVTIYATYFTVEITDSAMIGQPTSRDVLRVNYHTKIKDASSRYTNSMHLLGYYSGIEKSFELTSRFSEDGTSSIFPMLSGENQSFSLGELTASNAEQKLKQKIHALDTHDGPLPSQQITVDTSNIDFTKEGDYEVVYRAENSQGMIGAKTYQVKLVQATAAPVTVYYLDTAGQQLRSPDQLKGNLGSPYELKPKTIDGWSVKETPLNSQGVFSNQPISVTFIYERSNAAPVTLYYVDQEGTALRTPVTLMGKIGLPYHATAAVIPGFYLTETPVNQQGLFSKTTTSVFYKYERKNAASVKVSYQDAEGNLLADSEELTGKVGLPYQTEPKQLTGWQIKTTPTNQQGLFSETEQLVVYTYEPVTGAPVFIKYVDSEGNQLAAPEQLVGNIGATYQTTPKAFVGWQLADLPDNQVGQFSAEPVTVIYQYSKTTAAPVIVRYEDENGNELHKPEWLSGAIGTAYQTTPKALNGWTVKGQPNNAQGIFSLQPITVTYQYQKSNAAKESQQNAELVIYYLDESGNPLAEKTVIKGKVGETYQLKPRNFDTWRLVKLPENSQGTFAVESMSVVYRYQKKMGAAITVRYIDEQGNELAPTEIIHGKLGESYTMTAKTIENLNTSQQQVRLRTLPTAIDSYTAKELLYQMDTTLHEQAPTESMNWKIPTQEILFTEKSKATVIPTLIALVMAGGIGGITVLWVKSKYS